MDDSSRPFFLQIAWSKYTSHIREGANFSSESHWRWLQFYNLDFRCRKNFDILCLKQCSTRWYTFWSIKVCEGGNCVKAYACDYLLHMLFWTKSILLVPPSTKTVFQVVRLLKLWLGQFHIFGAVKSILQYFIMEILIFATISNIIFILIFADQSFHTSPMVSLQMHAHVQMKLTFVSTYAAYGMLLPLVLLLSWIILYNLYCEQQCTLGLWCGPSTILFRGSLTCLNWMIHRLLHYRPSHYKSRWWNLSHHNTDSWFSSFWKSSYKNYQTQNNTKIS